MFFPVGIEWRTGIQFFLAGIANYLTFAVVHLIIKFIKKGGGIGPMKPWQPSNREGANSISSNRKR